MILARTYVVLTNILMMFLLCAGQVLAVDDTFTVRTSVVGNDTTPPSIPQNVTATPAATTQIDVSWDASTDNVAVDGYQVIRDNVHIATTTLTSYSDTGLLPDTLYAYRIVAFDTSENYSTSSATTSATTLAEPGTDPSGGGNPYVPNDIRITSLRVVAEEYAVTIFWETSVVTRSKLQWGVSDNYELGSLAERAFRTWHQTTISGLVPGTRYELLITAEGTFGNVAEFEESFMTKALPDTTAPPNVRDFIARVVGSDIALSWANALSSDFDRVRIVKGKNFYPVDPQDGALIYEGADERTFDRDAGETPGPHYYAAFAYDKAGNVSSGAVAFAYVGDDGIIALPPEDGEPEDSSSAPTLRFDDFAFTQGGREVSVEGGSVVLQGSAPFTISIPYDRVPEHLKTILVTLRSPERPDSTFTFLLRVNEKKTAYSATIDALGAPGTYPLSLSLFDYANQTITKVRGAILVPELEPQPITPSAGFLGTLAQAIAALGLWLLLLLLLLLIAAYFALGGGDRRRHTNRHEVYLT